MTIASLARVGGAALVGAAGAWATLMGAALLLSVGALAAWVILLTSASVPLMICIGAVSMALVRGERGEAVGICVAFALGAAMGILCVFTTAFGGAFSPG